MLHTKYQSSALSSFREEEFWRFPCLFLFWTCDSRGRASFDLRGIIWTIFVEVHQEMLQTTAPSSFRKKEFWSFPSLFLCFELVTPRARPVLTPGASYEQSWYKSTRRCLIPNIIAVHFLVSEKKNFKVFLLCSYVSNLWPPGRGQFWPRGHHMNNLGRGPLGDTTYKYQSSALSSFREEEFRSFPSLFLCFELVTPGAGPVLTPGTSSEQSW